MANKGLGDAFAWGLDEDANDFTHLKQMTAEMKKFVSGYQGEYLDTMSRPLPSSLLKDEL